MSSDRSTDYPHYPKGKVIGSLDPSSVDAVKSALTEAGFAEDQIQSVVAADVEGVETPLTRTGIGGFVGRMLLTMGDSVERWEHIRQELAQGRALVAVVVEGDDAKSHAALIMRDHGARWINYFGSWVVEALD